MTKLIIIGAGGHGRVVADCALVTNKYQQIVFLDDCYPQRNKNALWPIIGPLGDFTQHIDNAVFFVAFGNNQLRQAIYKQLKAANATIVSIIHPSAAISSNAHIGKGVAVFANATINIASTIDDGCIINTSATIDHDCTLAPFVHISPNAAIAGGVNIGELSWIGINATVIECLTIAANTQVGAGAVIIKNTEENSLNVGVPAQRIKLFN